MKKILLVMLFLFSFTYQAKAYNLKVEVDSSSIVAGQEFKLIITADENVSESPNISPLMSDFKVVSNSTSHRVFINNGNRSSTTEWIIGLIATREGKIEIPALKVGNFLTAPVKINVESSSAVLPNDSKDFKYSISAKIASDKKSFYLQQEIPYWVTIIDNGHLQQITPHFEIESDDDWIIEGIGKPERKVETINGVKQSSVTLKYALFPQKSGKMKIPAVLFHGIASAPLSDSDLYAFGDEIVNINFSLPSIFNLSTQVNLFVPAKEIEIKPVPKTFRGNWWFPAENVKLSASWRDSDITFKEGDAFGREITLTAVGVLSNQLPKLHFVDTPYLKQYQQKGTTKEDVVNSQVVSIQKITNVYVPKKIGLIEIPEISVDWFNTTTGKMEKAVLPAETIMVEENFYEPLETEDEIPEKIKSDDSKISNKIKNFDSGLLKYVLLIVAFLLGVLVCWFMLAFRCPKLDKPQCEMRRYPDFIIQKAYQNDYRSLRDALVSWATGYYVKNSINTLKDVAIAADDAEFSEQIEILQEKLYSADSQKNWNAKIFVKAFKRILKESNKKHKNNSPLPPLYD